MFKAYSKGLANEYSQENEGGRDRSNSQNNSIFTKVQQQDKVMIAIKNAQNVYGEKMQFNTIQERKISQKDLEKYRVASKDLYFKIVGLGDSHRNKGNLERKYSDFKKLAETLKKFFPGCYVPSLPNQNSTESMPQNIFDFRKTLMECALIESFCNKIKTCPYLMDCEVISVFTNPRLSSSQIESQLKNLTHQSCSTSDTLNRFKQSFIKLSGREVDQSTHN
jgi:hypothetical protein